MTGADLRQLLSRAQYPQHFGKFINTNKYEKGKKGAKSLDNEITITVFH